MADYRTNMTSIAALDNSVYDEMDQAFIIAAHQNGIMDQFVSYKKDVNARAIEFPKYALLADATTALTDKEDVSSVAMSDSQIILTPAEYGNVVTRTQLVSAQSGGKSDLASAELVGINMQRTLNKLAILAGEAATNEIFANGAASEAALVAGDIMSPAFLTKLYNKLDRSGVQPLSEGMYVCVMHPDQIYDLLNGTGSGSWQDINKYARPDQVLRGEVGMLSGFRIISDAQVTINVDAGASAVDSYHALALGYNALGKAVSRAPELVVKPAGDALDRFQNVGWKAILKYGIVDSSAIWKGTSASSIGTNV